MHFTWLDYGVSSFEDEIDTWSTNKDTVQFVTAGPSPLSAEWAYYVDSGEYEIGKNCFCKVIIEREQLIAYILILCHGELSITINPIVVNPALRNRGYCTKVIRELLNCTAKIIPHSNCRRFEAVINIENHTSIRAFEKNGFALSSIHADGDVGYWQYNEV